MIALALTLLLSAPPSETVLFIEGPNGYGWILSQRPPAQPWEHFDREDVEVWAVAEPHVNDGPYYVAVAYFWKEVDRWVLWVFPSPRKAAYARAVIVTTTPFKDGFESGDFRAWSAAVEGG